MFEVGENDIIVQCECGRVWAMDYEPTPYECVGENWRLRVGDEWGIWVDENGNEVQVEKEPGDKLPEVREQESF